jgi:hypothetical protein
MYLDNGGNLMLQLELTDEEQHILKEILESDRSDLRMEIRETDNRTFKEMLKNKERVMEKILETLRQTD